MRVLLLILTLTILYDQQDCQVVLGFRLSRHDPCIDCSQVAEFKTFSSTHNRRSKRFAQPPPSAALDFYGDSSAYFFQLPPSYTFKWQHEQFSECSVTCGDGEEFAEVTCRDYKTGKMVLDIFCQEMKKPESLVRPCRQGKCQALWVTGEWDSCSVVCGGGVSRRSVYCAEEVQSGTYHRTLDRLCFGEKPDAERSCNMNDCPQWHAGQWSKCSRSCGTGVQQRVVVCRRTESYDCIDDMKPIAERVCHHQPCRKSDRDGRGCIHQQKERAGSLALNSREAERENIDTYNYRLMQDRSRGSVAGVSARSGLIKVDAQNRGIVVGTEFYPVLGPSTDSWEDEGQSSGDAFEAVISASFREEIEDRNDYGSGEETEKLEQRNSTGLTRLREGETQVDYYSVLQLEPLNNISLIAAQKSMVISLIPGTHLVVHCISRGVHGSSIWARNGVAISKDSLYIRNVGQEHVGNYVCLRGKKSSNITVILKTAEEAHLEKLARQDFHDSNKMNLNLTGLRLHLNGTIAPSSAVLDIAPLRYVVVSDWSTCKCEKEREEAEQRRTLTCELVTQSLAIAVDLSYCAKRRLQSIETKRNCSKSCYKWIVGEWKQCSDRPCTSPEIGTRWRSVECGLMNGSRVDETRCKSIGDRPIEKKPCSYKTCQGTWFATPWSKCSVSCGYKGVKTREVRCVWSTDVLELTGDESICSNETKPVTHKFCFNPPCSNNFCRDHSIYCSNVPMFGLCKLQPYSQKCCYSCSKVPYRSHQNSD